MNVKKKQEDAVILSNSRLQQDYYRLELQTPAVAALVQPGQFVHVRFPYFEHRVLRRPFSVCDVDTEKGTLVIVYKIVGEGTQHLSELKVADTVSVMGPLGIGFSAPEESHAPIIVAGGYGCAATYLLAKRSPVPCRVLIGGRSAQDLLLVEEFKALGCQVEVSTDDGTCGYHGLVTDLLAKALNETDGTPAVFACGPNPMLRAVSLIAFEKGVDAEISLDHAMCCGVGACFACVVKMKADNPDGWEYVRTCHEGPVFKASKAYWD